MKAGMSSTAILISTGGGGGGSTGFTGAGGSGSGSIVTATGIGLAPRPVTSRSTVTYPVFSKRRVYWPDGRFSNTVRPRSVRLDRVTTPVSVTLTSPTGAPDESVTLMANVTGP